MHVQPAATLVGCAIVLHILQVPLAGLLLSAAVGLSIWKFNLEVARRRQILTIFAKGDVPTVPNPNLFFGNTIQLFRRKNYSKFLQEKHSKLGQTFGFFYGPDPWAFTKDLDLIHRVWSTEGHKHPVMGEVRVPRIPIFVQSIIFSSYREWSIVRRSINPSFSAKNIKSFTGFRDREECCDKVLAYIAGQPVAQSDGDQHNERTVDAFYTFNAYTMDVILKTLLDRGDLIRLKVGVRDELVDSDMKFFDSLVGPVFAACVPFDWPRDLLAYLSQLIRFSRIIDRLFGSIFFESVKLRRMKLEERDELKPIEAHKLIDALMEWPSDANTRDLNVLAHLFFIFAAGFSSSGSALTALFWMLGKHQNIQHKLRESIITDGVDSLYLEWCFKETLRLYPSVPAVSRILGEDIITRDGKTLFKGTTVAASVYTIHHDEQLWGPDVYDFRPDRFERPYVHEQQFLAFGAGPRGCVGRLMAMRQMKELAARILIAYRVEHGPSTPEELKWGAPELVNIRFKGPIDLKFVELSTVDAGQVAGIKQNRTTPAEDRDHSSQSF